MKTRNGKRSKIGRNMPPSWNTLLRAALVLPLASGLNTCLDPASTEFRCAPGTDKLVFWAPSCGLVDADMPDLLACFDIAGRATVTSIDLTFSDMTTFPVGMFQGFPALDRLKLSSSQITTYEDGLFDDVAGSLTYLGLVSSALLTSVPEGLFTGLTKLTYLGLNNNKILQTLPVGLFKDNKAVETLNLNFNGLIALPLGIFDGLAEVVTLPLQFNEFTTLPAGIFEPLTKLDRMWFHGVPLLQCVPTNTATQLRFNSPTAVGGTCECTPAEAVSCPTGTTCSPGTEGYSCDATDGGPSPVPETPAPGPVGGDDDNNDDYGDDDGDGDYDDDDGDDDDYDDDGGHDE